MYPSAPVEDGSGTNYETAILSSEIKGSPKPKHKARQHLKPQVRNARQAVPYDRTREAQRKLPQARTGSAIHGLLVPDVSGLVGDFFQLRIATCPLLTGF